ncbi:50S ribosomal protein L23 [candidate division WWE3 bacterium]|nr:50S ribosomal protein L23 [candidate division WWE3 bacterium]
MKLGNILKRPIITEKSTALGAHGKYSFEVDIKASKSSIAKSVEESFKVDVLAVRTHIVAGKQKRAMRGRKRLKLPKWKKAVVTVKKGQTINLFEVKG